MNGFGRVELAGQIVSHATYYYRSALTHSRMNYYRLPLAVCRLPFVTHQNHCLAKKVRPWRWSSSEPMSICLVCSHFHFGVPNDFSKQMA